MGNHIVSISAYPVGATSMCDEYYDARVRAYWRALEEAKTDEELETGEDELVIKPVVLEPLEPQKLKPKALVR